MNLVLEMMNFVCGGGGGGGGSCGGGGCGSDFSVLEHVPPQLNQGDSRGAEDGRGYRH
jgi:hypothetical protein